MVDHFGGGSVTQMIVNHRQHSHVQLRVGNGQHTREHSSAKDVLTVDVPRPNSTVLLEKYSFKNVMYRKRTIITRVLYIYHPIFEVIFLFSSF